MYPSLTHIEEQELCRHVSHALHLYAFCPLRHSYICSVSLTQRLVADPDPRTARPRLRLPLA